MGRKLQLTRRIAHYTLCLALIAAVAALRMWVVQVVTVHGSGCRPALLAGDRVAVALRAYSAAEPQRGDLVAFTDPRSTDSICVGHIMACPGDTLWIGDDGQLGRRSTASDLVVVPRAGQSLGIDIQDIRLYNAAINRHESVRSTIVGSQLYITGRAVEEYRFAHSYYWISTTPQGIDSRQLGLIPDTLIRGRVWRVLYSRDPQQDWLHGWRRERTLMRLHDASSF